MMFFRSMLFVVALAGLVNAGPPTTANQLRGAREPLETFSSGQPYQRRFLNETDDTNSTSSNGARLGGAQGDAFVVELNENTAPDEEPAASSSGPSNGGSSQSDGVDVDLGSMIGVTCFSELATVNILNKGVVTMKDLRVGDRVLTASNNYQPVYAFGHRNPKRRAQFWQLHTKETVLEMTGEHLVFLQDQAHPVRADSLRVGSPLLGLDGTPQDITKIEKVQREGVYTPFTPDGTVVVNGIVASSYASLQQDKHFVELQNGVVLPLSMHDGIHLGLSPLRWFCMGWDGDCDALNDEGLHPYVSFAISASQWADRQYVTVQVLLLVLGFSIYLPIFAAETMFGADLQLILALVLVGLAFCRNRRGGSANKKAAVRL